MSTSRITFEQAKEILDILRRMQKLVKGERAFHSAVQTEELSKSIQTLVQENTIFLRAMKGYYNGVLAKKLNITPNTKNKKNTDVVDKAKFSDLKEKVFKSTSNDTFCFYSAIPSLYRFFNSHECINSFFNEMKSIKDIKKKFDIVAEIIYQTPEFILFIRALFLVANTTTVPNDVTQIAKYKLAAAWEKCNVYCPYMVLAAFKAINEDIMKQKLLEMLTSQKYQNLYCVPLIAGLSTDCFDFFCKVPDAVANQAFTVYNNGTYSLVKKHIGTLVHSNLDNPELWKGFFKNASIFNNNADVIFEINISSPKAFHPISNQTQSPSMQKRFRHLLKYSRDIPVLRGTELPPDIETFGDLIMRVLVERAPIEYMDDVIASFINDMNVTFTGPGYTQANFMDSFRKYETNADVATIEKDSLTSSYRIMLQTRVLSAMRVFAQSVKGVLEASANERPVSILTRADVRLANPDLPLHEELLQQLIKEIGTELPNADFYLPTTAVFEIAVNSENDVDAAVALNLLCEMAAGWENEAFVVAIANVKTRQVLETLLLVKNFREQDYFVRMYAQFTNAIETVFPGFLIW